MPLSPDWKNLPRRKCDDCGKSYKPTRPRRVLNGKEELGFCSPNCRKSYHKHGGAYRKLRGEMEKMIAKRMDALRSEFRGMVQEELRKYAQYARVVEDFSTTLRIPTPTFAPLDKGIDKRRS